MRFRDLDALLYGDAPPASESQLTQLTDDVGDLLGRLAASLDAIEG